MLVIDPWTFYYAALLVLLVPLPWIFAAFTAAAIHELCHLAAIFLFGETIHGIFLRPGGAVIEASFSERRTELIAALAGPAGSLCLLSLCHIFPKLALCAMIQGLFNLLPLYPLDGGRILALLLRKTPCKDRRNRVQ